ncbi:hypothetical protein HI914_00651 [Erysiphe necator]|uniref:Uncharacterized protein n=1 Tax=Uncinula necator TaxID=52586 RepID=A0A0B1PCV2_UNCNE|nr:hypothetical protein HI914_00651 [Erysiphe necator]KHJ34489.1 hypothetical protein EV44_g5177 [Erysiphe necator]
MSAAVAMTPSPAPHDRSSYMDRANPSSSNTSKSSSASSTTAPPPTNYAGSRPSSRQLKATTKATATKTSPKIPRNESISSVIVKKEPTSPDIRHRPQKLDLSASNNNAKSSNEATNSFPHTGTRPLAGPLTARMDGLGIQEVGLACISPGFNTQDPTKRDHLQRSMSVREQQRTLIESRMNKQSAMENNVSLESTKDHEAGTANASKGPVSSKKKVPPGLSIVAPSHEDFAQERIIQSAPLNHSFTSSRYNTQPLTRHTVNQPSNFSKTSHIHHVNTHNHVRSPIQPISATSANTTIHHVPAIQTSSRLPPIMDIFAGESLALRQSIGQGSSHTNGATSNSAQSNNLPPFPSPGQSGTQTLQSGRSREYRSAEDAQADLSGGRPELLPKIVHYGGHQPPPTPPSPRTTKSIRLSDPNHSGGSRRRTRVEYEEGSTPPLGNGPSTGRRTGPFGESRSSPTNSQKKEQFIRLCADAWDLFHS